MIEHRPSAYKHIAAWCRINRLPDDARRALQKFASATFAPVDALYYNFYANTWITMRSAGHHTRDRIEAELKFRKEKIDE